MSKIVVLAPFASNLSSGPRQFRPGEVVDSAQMSVKDYAATVAAAPTKHTAAFDSPSAGLIAAQSQAVAIRLNGGDPENQTEGVMYRAMF
jgi:hypothetical protein